MIKNIISKITLIINKNCKFDSVRLIKLLSIKVKNVIKPTDNEVIKIKTIKIFFLIKSIIV